MRTWAVVDPEGYAWFYRAETRGKARQAHRAECGLDWWEVMECSVRTAPALDGLEPTPWNLIRLGYICHGEMDCGHEFYHCGEPQSSYQYEYYVVGETVYCSADCAARLHRWAPVS